MFRRRCVERIDTNVNLILLSGDRYVFLDLSICLYVVNLFMFSIFISLTTSNYHNKTKQKNLGFKELICFINQLSYELISMKLIISRHKNLFWIELFKFRYKRRCQMSILENHSIFFILLYLSIILTRVLGMSHSVSARHGKVMG